MEEIKANQIYPTITYSLLISFVGSLLLIPSSKFEPSLGFAIFFILILLSNFIIIRVIKKEYKPNIINLFLVISYLFLSLGFFINTKTHFLNIILLFLLLPLINITLTSNSLNKNFIWRSILLGIYYLIAKITAPFITLINLWKDYSSRSDNAFLNNKLNSILKYLGLFLITGLPLIIIVTLLLSSTNDNFAQLFSNIFHFNFISSTWIVRIIFTVMFTIFFIGELFFVSELQTIEPQIKSKDLKFSKSFDKTFTIVTIITLFCLNFLYLVYVFTELKYDISDVKDLVFKKNFDSFSQLAVSRFWELIIVSFINLVIFYFLIRPFKAIKKDKDNLISKLVIGNGILLFINTAFLIFSVHKRLSLYESGYGFTNKRLLAHSFLPILFIVTLILFTSLFYKKYHRLLQVSIGLMVLFFSVYIALPTDYITNKINLELAKSGKIEVYDPTMTIKDNTYYLEDYSITQAQYNNEINSNDGLILVKEILNTKEINLTDAQKKFLENGLHQYQQNSNDLKWRERNLTNEILNKK